MTARSLAAVIVVVSAVCGVGVGACAPEVTVTVVRADDLDAAFPIDVIAMVFRLNGALSDPLLVDPFPINAPPSAYVEVPPDTPFSVDVLGCGDNGCTSEGQLDARGCADGFQLARGEVKTLTIELHKVDIGNDACPVEDPASEDVGFEFFDPGTATGEGEGEGE